MNPKVKFKLMGNGTLETLPKYETDGSAGMDLSSTDEATLWPGQWKLFRCGFAMELPEGFNGEVRPRSGLALKHGVTVLNSPGTIDFGFSGEVGVILINHNKEPFKVEKGMRIAQLIIAPVSHAEVEVVDKLSESVRGERGFGSSGLR